MLSYNNELYLPSKKLYTLPGRTDYTEAKNALLQKIDNNYLGKLVAEKWSLLMQVFRDSLRDDDCPYRVVEDRVSKTVRQVRLTKSEFQQELYDFQATQAAASQSLSQYCQYFENYYFLYTTRDPNFELSDTAKKSLIQALYRCLDTCPTGQAGEFYATLNDHQKDTDWIKNQLSQARYMLMQQLANIYNSFDMSAATFGWHQSTALIRFANQHHLGILQTESHDSLTWFTVDSKKITDFFNTHYLAAFQKYEQDSIQTLTLYAISEIGVLFNDKEAWQRGAVHMTDDPDDPRQEAITEREKTRTLLAGLQQTLKRLFQEDGMKIWEQLASISENHTQTTIKSQPDCEQILKTAITEKLISEQHYISIHDLENDLLLQQQITLRSGVSFADFFAVYHALQNNQFTLEHIPYQNVLRHYSDLVLSHMRHNPAAVVLLPKSQLSAIDAARIILDEQLCAAITLNDQQKITTITQYIITLLAPDYRDLSLLSDTIRNYPGVQQLFQKQYPHFEESSVLTALCTTRRVTADQFFAWTIQLTPQQLNNIIETRRNQNLPALPFCEQASLTKDLQAFSYEVQTKLLYSNSTRTSWRRQAYNYLQREFESSEGALTCIVNTDHWFKGFMQYQANKSAAGKQPKHFMFFLNTLFSTLLRIAGLYVAYQCCLFISPVLSAFISALFWPMIIGVIALLLLRILLSKRHFTAGAALLAIVAIFDYAIWAMFIGVAIVQIIQISSQLKTIWALMTIGATALRNACTSAPPSMTTTTEHCDHIIQRLLILDTPSALQKARILKDLQTCMSTEAYPEDHTLLDKAYDISYQGKEYSVSFAEVAARRRIHESDFSLEPEHFWFTFFKTRTSSTQLLAPSTVPQMV